MTSRFPLQWGALRCRPTGLRYAACPLERWFPMGLITLEPPENRRFRHVLLPQAGDAFGGSAGASSRPRDHRGKPPCPAARRRGLSDHLPMLWPTGHLGSHWPVRESGVPLRLQREPAALAGASRGLSGGSDHHQQAEEECASGHCWSEWERVVCGLVVAPAERPFARNGGAPRIVGVQRAMVSL